MTGKQPVSRAGSRTSARRAPGMPAVAQDKPISPVTVKADRDVLRTLAGLVETQIGDKSSSQTKSSLPSISASVMRIGFY